METWAIVALVLGSSAISALLTFFITKMQVRHSDRRLEKELERAREADRVQRRREVRSEPLLKLRNELARMATMQNRVVIVAQRQYTRIGDAEEKAKKELQEAVDDWNAYLASPDFTVTLFIQYDTELVNKVKEIQGDYIAFYNNIMRSKELKTTEREEAMRPTEKIWPKVIEAQSLINNLLEEL